MKRMALLALVGVPLCTVPASAQWTYLRPAELSPHLRANSSMERGWRLLDQRLCTAVTDGCNRATRTWSPDPGRYIERGSLIAYRPQTQPTWLLISRDAPTQNDGIVGTATAVDCPARHEWICVAGSPPAPAPLPPREGPPIGQGWLGQTELHESWIDLSSWRYSVGCHPLDYRLSVTRKGDLLPRKPNWGASLCGLAPEAAQ
jgi:hypothetical protein